MKVTIITFALLLAVSSCSLDNFLFEPEKEEYNFSDNIISAENRELYTLKANDNIIYGLYVFHSNGSNKKILYYHGNYRNLNHYYKWIEIYYEMGYDVFAIDYEGFGKSEGNCSEEALLRDAESAINFVINNLQWELKDIIIYGYSLGSIPAIYIATKYSCKLLFLEAPIGSADTIVNGSSPISIPSEFVVVKKYNNLERIKRSKNKVVIIQGEADETLPYKDNGLKLYENAPEPKKFVLLTGEVGHGDIPTDIGRDSYKQLLQELFNF